MKKNLVIVRAGDNSLHREWLSPRREWDIIVSGYGDSPPAPPEGCVAHHFKGAKWNGIYDAIAANEDFVFAHERIMLPDDDLRMCAGDINAVFAIGEALDLRLYQPSITGFCSWGHLRCRRDCLLRYVTMVEVMTPVMHRDILRPLWRDFRKMRSGAGMDLYWGVFAAFPHCAVLDCVPVEHTRPVGGAQPGSPKNELILNGMRRNFPFADLALKSGEFLYGDIAAVKNDMRIEHRARMYKSRLQIWRRLFGGKRISLKLKIPRDGLAAPSSRAAETPQLIAEFEEYAANKDFTILARLDRRPSKR